MTQAGKNFWQEKINIGTLQVPRFMSAPIDGITDSPTRQLIRDFSPEILLFTEMRHVAQVANEKSKKSLQFEKIEHPICFQISANNTNFIEKAIGRILEKNVEAINLNVGCPAKNIVKAGAGSALMANIPELKNIIKIISNAINGKVPLTIKIRAGFKEKNAIEVSLLAQDMGIQAIIIHPRTQPEAFFAPLDFNLVKQIKEKVQIPVIFSGNINSFEKAKNTHALTGVDGFMIGRALYGAPWKIREIMEAAGDNTFNLDHNSIINIALKHLKLSGEFYGDKVGFNVIKQQLPAYIKNDINAHQTRKALMTSQSHPEMEKILTNLLVIKN
jgi:tRNA-dihydrouridine synthase B